jgi:ankyrin repeat protein
MSLRSAIVMDDMNAVMKLVARKQPPSALGEGLVSACALCNERMVPVLLNAGADPNWASHRSGEGPLSHAIASTAIVQMLLRSGADPNGVRNARNGRTPIFASQSADVVKLLLGAGAISDLHDSKGFTPLIRFISVCDAACVAAVLAGGADPNYPDRSGNSPLTYALMLQPGDTERLNALERILGDLRRAGALETGPLTAKTIAAFRDGDVAKVTRFLASGHSADILGPFGVRPIVMAAACGSTAVVKQLLAAGADVNLLDGSGMTSLMAAARGNTALPGGGYLDIVNLLVEAGADIDAVSNPQDEGDLSAMWYAKEHRNGSIVAYLRSVREKQHRVSRYAPMRGIHNDEIMQRMVLLQAGINDVSRELASWLGGTMVSGVLEKDVRLGVNGFQVGQFQAHRWTFINPLAGGAAAQLDKMAAELSQRLRCQGLLYIADESHTALRYRLYDSHGTEVESLDYCKLQILTQRLRALPKDSPHRESLEQLKAGKGTRLASRLRQVKRIGDPFSFFSQFAGRLGAFVPAFTPDAFNPGDTVRLAYPEIEPADLVRMDIVTKSGVE